MRRREFITLLSGAAATWPLGVRAQQGAGLSQAANGPLVGFLNSASPDTYRFNADSFREGLAQAGFVEGRNVRIEERWAKGDYQALPESRQPAMSPRHGPHNRQARSPLFSRSAPIRSVSASWQVSIGRAVT
jgi:hypothetical protein